MSNICFLLNIAQIAIYFIAGKYLPEVRLDPVHLKIKLAFSHSNNARSVEHLFISIKIEAPAFPWLLHLYIHVACKSESKRSCLSPDNCRLQHIHW